MNEAVMVTFPTMKRCKLFVRQTQEVFDAQNGEFCEPKPCIVVQVEVET